MYTNFSTGDKTAFGDGNMSDSLLQEDAIPDTVVKEETPVLLHHPQPPEQVQDVQILGSAAVHPTMRFDEDELLGEPSNPDQTGEVSLETGEIRNAAATAEVILIESEPKKEKPKAQEYFCELCKAKCNGEVIYQQHLKGARHRKNMANAKFGGPIIKNPKKKPKRAARLMAKLSEITDAVLGLEYLIEHQKEDDAVEERYICDLCEAKCDPRTVIYHITGTKHRMAYLKKHHPESLAEITGRRETEIKRSALSAKLAEIAKVVESEHGRKQIQVKVELDPFYNPFQQRLEAQAAQKRQMQMEDEQRAKIPRGGGAPKFGPGGRGGGPPGGRGGGGPGGRGAAGGRGTFRGRGGPWVRGGPGGRGIGYGPYGGNRGGLGGFHQRGGGVVGVAPPPPGYYRPVADMPRPVGDMPRTAPPLPSPAATGPLGATQDLSYTSDRSHYTPGFETPAYEMEYGGGGGGGRFEEDYWSGGVGGGYSEDFDPRNPYIQRSGSIQDRLMTESMAEAGPPRGFGPERGRGNRYMNDRPESRMYGEDRFGGPREDRYSGPSRYDRQDKYDDFHTDDLRSRHPVDGGGPGRKEFGSLLKDLSQCMVHNEDDAAMALQVSNALTQSLLNYRLRSVPSDLLNRSGQLSQMLNILQGGGGGRGEAGSGYDDDMDRPPHMWDPDD